MSFSSRAAQRWYGYRPSKKAALAASVAGLALFIAVGFGSGAWVTGGRARMLSALAADEARADLVASACVNRFLAAPDAAARLDALRDRAGWRRGLVLQGNGWTTLSGLRNLPGSEEPFEGAADLCAKRLMAVATPPAADTHVANSGLVLPHV